VPSATVSVGSFERRQRLLDQIALRVADRALARGPDRAADRAEPVLDGLPLRVDDFRRPPETELRAPVRQVALRGHAIELGNR